MYFYLYRYQHLKRSLGLKQERSFFTSKWNSLPFDFTQILDRFSVHLFHASQFGLQCILVSCILVLSLGYQCFLAKTHFVSGKSVCFTVNRIRIYYLYIICILLLSSSTWSINWNIYPSHNCSHNLNTNHLIRCTHAN